MGHRINVDGKTPIRSYEKPEIDRQSGRQIGTLTIASYTLVTIKHGSLEIPYKKLREIEHVEAKGNLPAYDVFKFGHVFVHLHDGITPDQEGLVVGHIEIDAKFVTPSRTDGVENAHLMISVHALKPGSAEEPNVQEVFVWHGTSYQEPSFNYEQRFGPDSKNGNIFVL